MEFTIKNARMLDGAIVDVEIANGLIKNIGSGLNNGEILDAEKNLLIPGLVDLHTHLREPGREDSETVATGGSYSFHSSVVDSGKHLHICYLDGGKLKYATNLSGSWVSSQLTIADAFGLSLAIDSTDHLHVSFYDKTQGVLNYATNNSGAWTIVPVDSSGNVGWYNAIAVDSNKKIHIGYFDMTNGKVKYATNGP